MEKEDLAYKVSDDFNIFVISDGTGKTATSVVHAALLQFDLPRVSIMDFAHVRSQEQICSILDMVEPQKDIVVYTVVDEELLHTLRAELLSRGLLALDLLGPLVEVLKKVSSRQPRGIPGLFRRLEEQSSELEALEYAWKSSGGFSVSDLKEADIVLLGVWYPHRERGILMLAEKGIKAAFLMLDPNLPLPPHFEDTIVSSLAKPVLGLKVDANYLSEVRRERIRALGLYDLEWKADIEVVEQELDFANRVYDRLGCQVIDITGLNSKDLVNTIISQIKKEKEEV